jgi:hypothetical protein
MYFKYRSKAGREFEIGLDGGVWLLVFRTAVRSSEWWRLKKPILFRMACLFYM